jgi:hypothetical protein
MYNVLSPLALALALGSAFASSSLAALRRLGEGSSASSSAAGGT